MSRQTGHTSRVSLRHSLLGLLAEQPRTGYELTRLFDESLLNVWPASHSQIYPELAKLVADGLIHQTASGPRGKKVYAITPDGHDEVMAWLRTEPDHSTKNPSFLRVFFLWLMEPEDAIAFLEREALVHETKLVEFETKAEQPVRDAPGGWAFRLALDWGVRYEREMLEWNASARRAIEERRKPATSARARR
jgi:PadR family transcriptional regulator, regulatory protein AphA